MNQVCQCQMRSVSVRPFQAAARVQVTRNWRAASTLTARCQQAPPRFDLVQAGKGAGAAALLTAALLCSGPALADLNKYEQAAGGEFGTGSAMQYGSAELEGKDFSGQDLRRANFTSANIRSANFKGAKLQGAYFIKAVAPKANFEGANLSDVLMDRAVLNEANLKNANLERTIFTRSDLSDADIEGADVTNALLDRAMQTKLCRYASGTNSVTGVETRSSLGCSSRRKFRESSPSNPEGPQAAEEDKEAFRQSMPTYGREGYKL